MSGLFLAHHHGYYFLDGEILLSNVEAGEDRPIERVEARQKEEVGEARVNPERTPEVTHAEIVPVGRGGFLWTGNVDQEEGVAEMYPKEALVI